MEGISQVVNASTSGTDRTPIAIVVPGLTSDSSAAVNFTTPIYFLPLFMFCALRDNLTYGLLLLTQTLPLFFLHSILNILPSGWQRKDGMLLCKTTVDLEGYL